MNLNSIVMHQQAHAIRLQPAHHKTSLQRQIDTWVKLGAQKQRGVDIVIESGNGWGGGIVFRKALTLPIR